jgi:hypothetical protein
MQPGKRRSSAGRRSDARGNATCGSGFAPNRQELVPRQPPHAARSLLAERRSSLARRCRALGSRRSPRIERRDQSESDEFFGAEKACEELSTSRGRAVNRSDRGAKRRT